MHNDPIEQILNSLDGARQADLPEGFIEKALKRATTPDARVVAMPRLQVWSAAAAIAVLIFVNVSVWMQTSGSRGGQAIDAVAAEYFSITQPVPF